MSEAHTFGERYESCYHNCCSTLYVTCSCGWERLIYSGSDRKEQVERAQLAHRMDVLEGKA